MAESGDPIVDSGLVQFLEGTLALAKGGHVRAFIGVMVGYDSGTASSWSTADGPDRMRLLAEATCLQQRILDRIREVNDGAI